MEQEAEIKLDLSGLGSFDFTPDWAKGGAKVSVGKIRPQADERRTDKPAGERKGFGGRGDGGRGGQFGGGRGG